jgi:hypothetical protein
VGERGDAVAPEQELSSWVGPMDCVRIAASRNRATAGTKSTIRKPMIAMTTRISIMPKPRRRKCIVLHVFMRALLVARSEARLD